MDAASRSGETLVFFPTYNERSTVGRLLDAIVGLPDRCDVLVVDDNSTDGTGAILKERAAADPRVKYLGRPEQLGIGSAHRLGWLYARHCAYARIVTLDADLSHDPLDIPRLLKVLDEGADVAVGSRFMVGGQLDLTGWRGLLSRTSNWLARCLLRLPCTEYTSSLRAACLDRVPAGLVETIPNNGYVFFLTTIVRIARQGLRIIEIPVHFHDRDAGRSKMPKLEIVRAAINLLYLTVRRQPYDPKLVDVGPFKSCSVCGESYLVPTAFGQTECLFCMHRSS